MSLDAGKFLPAAVEMHRNALADHRKPRRWDMHPDAWARLLLGEDSARPMLTIEPRTLLGVPVSLTSRLREGRVELIVDSVNRTPNRVKVGIPTSESRKTTNPTSDENEKRPEMLERVKGIEPSS
ncbi:hypothetical protein [Rhizorhabdus sp.]|uniref:hypothetical protein n=1 Tax=Rhizorhabdus sp. TaxID=1968843 RepID=UPI0035B34881